MIPRATIDDLLSWRPCPDYPERRIRELAGEAISFTALDVLRREDIPEEDRLWVVLRPEMLGALLVPAVCDIAERALPMWEAVYPDDMRPRQCLEVAQRFVVGEATSIELAAAGDVAVLVAVLVAAGGVAVWGVVAAVRDACALALTGNPWAAWNAWAAAQASWAAASGEAEAAWQVQHLIEMLEREV